MFAAGVATFAQLYAFQAALPGIATSFGVGAADAALTLSLATGGLAGFVVVWSAVADRFGRTRAMAASMIGSTVVGLVAPLAPDLASLVVIRGVHGLLLGGVPAVAVAYLAEETHPAFLMRATGLHIAGNTLGGMSGRLLAGAVTDLAGWRWGVAANSLWCVVALIVFLVVLPPARGHRRTGVTGRAVAGRLVAAVRDRALLGLYAQAFLLMGAFVTVYNYLGFHLLAPPFGVSPLVVSLMFLAYLAGAAGSAVAGRVGRASRRHGLLLAGAGCMAAGVALTSTPWMPLIVGGLLLFTVGFFGAHATASAWVGNRATMTRAQAATCYTLAFYLGSSLFGWLGGVVYLALDWVAVVGYVVALCTAAALASLALRGR